MRPGGVGQGGRADGVAEEVLSRLGRLTQDGRAGHLAQDPFKRASPSLSQICASASPPQSRAGGRTSALAARTASIATHRNRSIEITDPTRDGRGNHREARRPAGQKADRAVIDRNRGNVRIGPSPSQTARRTTSFAGTVADLNSTRIRNGMSRMQVLKKSGQVVAFQRSLKGSCINSNINGR